MPKKTKTPTEPRPSTPMPGRVWEDDEFRPIGIVLEEKTLEVVSIDDRVVEESEWWEPEPVYEMHYRVSARRSGGSVAISH